MDIGKNIVDNFLSENEEDDEILKEPLSIKKHDFLNEKIIDIL